MTRLYTNIKYIKVNIMTHSYTLCTKLSTFSKPEANGNPSRYSTGDESSSSETIGTTSSSQLVKNKTKNTLNRKTKVFFMVLTL